MLVFAGCGMTKPTTSEPAPSRSTEGDATAVTEAGAAASGTSVPVAGSRRIVQPGAPGEPSSIAETGATADRVISRNHTAADVQFMQGMIAHHAQALVMTAMTPDRAVTDAFKSLSRRIEISQASEIEMMQRWLRARGEAVPSQDAMHHHHMGGSEMMMPGMLSEAQLAEMRAATGREYERLFLTYMIGHHDGALVMVDDLFSQYGAAQDSDIYRFASDVDADQRMEISRMRAMLDSMDS